MADFPRLSTGSVTQYPSGRRSSYSTHVTRYVDGSEQRFRELKAPVRRWLIRLDEISAQEAAAIEMCFLAAQGEFGSFSFVDPWDGTEYPNCSFDQGRLAITAIADSENKTHLVIRNNSL